MPDEEILGVDALAGLLGVPPETVRSWVEQEKIPFFRIDDFVGFRRKTLLRWFAQLERENPANQAHMRLLYAPRPSRKLTAQIAEAVEQLKSDDPDARLAGIFTLEALAERSPTGAEQFRHVLTARLRCVVDAWRTDLADGEVLYLPVEVQHLLNVVTRLECGRLDLRDMFLPRADLSKTRLGAATMVNVCLRQADLRETDLTGAALSWADLGGARLSGANLSRANLTGANLEGAHLTDACLRDADLHGARLAGARLEGADLTGANLEDARGLTEELLACAVVDSTTVLPEMFKDTIRLLEADTASLSSGGEDRPATQAMESGDFPGREP